MVTSLSVNHQKENTATWNGGLIFFHFTQQVLKLDIATFQAILWSYSIILFAVSSQRDAQEYHEEEEKTRVERSKERNMEAGNLKGVS